MTSTKLARQQVMTLSSCLHWQSCKMLTRDHCQRTSNHHWPSWTYKGYSAGALNHTGESESFRESESWTMNRSSYWHWHSWTKDILLQFTATPVKVWGGVSKQRKSSLYFDDCNKVHRKVVLDFPNRHSWAKDILPQSWHPEKWSLCNMPSW